MVFADFVRECGQRGINAQGWKRAKDAGVLSAWIDPRDGKHYISSGAAPTFDYAALQSEVNGG